jgi:hypothetical protein
VVCDVLWTKLQQLFSLEVHRARILHIVNHGHQPAKVRPVGVEQSTGDPRHGGRIAAVIRKQYYFETIIRL